MFKTVSRDHETTAALQAEYLSSLLARDGHSYSTPNIGSMIQDPAIFLPFGGNSDPALPSQGPYIDITDFDAWMSAFELNTMPDPLPLDGSAGDDDQAMGTAQTLALPTTGDITDWDAVRLALLLLFWMLANARQIFLSWLNPDPAGHQGL